MVLYGAEHLTERAQAYDLLERAARLHWGWDRLPELAREERGKPTSRSPVPIFNLPQRALCPVRPVGPHGGGGHPGGPPRLVPKAGDRSCTPEERAWLAALGDRPEDFAALWAWKRATGKSRLMAWLLLHLPNGGPAARDGGACPRGGVSPGGAAAPGLRRPGLAGGGVRLGGAAGGDSVAVAALSIANRTWRARRVKRRALSDCQKTSVEMNPLRIGAGS